MKISEKTVSKKIYLTAKKELTMTEIAPFAESTIPALHAEMGKLGLDMVGPEEFIYLNMSEDLKAPFTLYIALPVREKLGEPENFDFVTFDEAKCVYTEHHGPVSTVGSTWEEFGTKVKNAWYCCNSFK